MIWLFFLLALTEAHAEIISDWSHSSIDREHYAANAALLQQLNEEVFPNPITTEGSFNQKRMIKAWRQRSDDQSVLITPVLCRLGVWQLAMTPRFDASTGELITVLKVLKPIAQFFNKSGKVNADTRLEIKKMLETTTSRPSQLPGLKLGISFLKRPTRIDRSHDLCALYSLAAAIQEAEPVRIKVESDALLFWQQLQAAKPMRATRQVAFSWTDFQCTSECRVQMQWRWSEAIFGSQWRETQASGVSFSYDNDGIRWQLPGDFKEEILRKKSEMQGLPKVVMIRGAWAYLDRGRGYGLDMNDRLTTAGSKGHIVGFFGAGMNLKSSQGNIIDEGAVMFVRNGRVSVGDSVDFDPQTYPTDWPPKSSSP